MAPYYKLINISVFWQKKITKFLHEYVEKGFKIKLVLRGPLFWFRLGPIDCLKAALICLLTSFGYIFYA